MSLLSFKKSVDVKPQMQAVLARVSDPEVRRALTRLTAQAADALADVQALDIPARDLPRNSLEEQARTAAAWPLARKCMAAADALLATVREHFPEPAGGDTDLDAAFGGGSAPAAPPPADPGAGVRAVAWGLAHELDRVRASLDGPVPSAPDEAWRALLGLQELRGKLRSGVSELIYEAYRVHAPVTREEVIPGYRERLTAAIELRRDIGRLRRAVLPLCERVKTAARMDLGAVVTDLFEAVGGFCASPAFAALRLADRKLAASFRKRLAHLQQSPAPAPGRDLAEDLARFVEGLAAISRREMLIVHDASAILECRGHVKAALMGGVPHLAEAQYALALQSARDLEGIDADLDAFLVDAGSWSGDRPPEFWRAAAERLSAIVQSIGATRT